MEDNQVYSVNHFESWFGLSVDRFMDDGMLVWVEFIP